MTLSSTQNPSNGSSSVHLIAGVASGIIGLVVFLVSHQLWIAPIWFILPIGLVIATVGGLAVGWAYHELSPHLPSRPWSNFAVVALIAVILAPAIVLAELRQPLFTVTEMGTELSVSVGYATAIFILELLVSATLAGGLAGWLIGRSSRAALSTAIAGLVFALGPGHNIPFLGNSPATGKGIALLLFIILPAAFILVEMSAFVSGWTKIKRSSLIMDEAALFRFAGWSAYFNATIFIISLVALMLFFSIGGIWGTINDSLSILWMLSYVPLAVAFFQINRSVNTSISLVSSIIGIAAAIVFIFLQTLLVLGRVRFEQTFTAVLAMTALVGLFVLIHALLARAGHTLPYGLTWVMIIYGIASMVGAVGFQIGGEQHPLAMIGLLLTAISGLVWVIWFGRLLLAEKIAIALAGSA